MPRKFRIAYFAHAIRSDWNNGNAHFLRGLLRSLGQLGHEVTIFEPEAEWSINNLHEEELGPPSLAQFAQLYPELSISTYPATATADVTYWRPRLRDTDIVIVHEWNPPALAHSLLDLRDQLGYRMLFHDTHHRASSSPEQIGLFGVDRFDGVLAFGEVLRNIYRSRFGITRVWTLHEAADTSIFYPRTGAERQNDVVWVGNWGDNERAAEIAQFLLLPAAHLKQLTFTVFGVRYPQEGLNALHDAGVHYSGYLPNLQAPRVFAESALTLHIPRQQYSQTMIGIPTIRVFEALASGIPLISAPWQDSEHLFREGDFAWVSDCGKMTSTIERLLSDPAAAQAQAQRGRETVLAHHTCNHRAQQLTSICEEVSR